MWEDVHEAVDKGLIQDAIGSILNSLKERHRTVLICRFWLGMTLKETGKKCGVTQERIRQAEAKALRILRSERYVKEFDKLGLGWIQRIHEDLEKEKKREAEIMAKEAAEWHRKCVEEKIAKEKERKAREKLKIVDSAIPKPEVKVQTYAHKPPYFPPFFVKLVYINSKPVLHVDSSYGSIDRRLDPETYDRWLAYLIDPKSTKVWNDKK